MYVLINFEVNYTNAFENRLHLFKEMVLFCIIIEFSLSCWNRRNGIKKTFVSKIHHAPNFNTFFSDSLTNFEKFQINKFIYNLQKKKIFN